MSSALRATSFRAATLRAAFARPFCLSLSGLFRVHARLPLVLLRAASDQAFATNGSNPRNDLKYLLHLKTKPQAWSDDRIRINALRRLQNVANSDVLEAAHLDRISFLFYDLMMREPDEQIFRLLEIYRELIAAVRRTHGLSAIDSEISLSVCLPLAAGLLHGKVDIDLKPSHRLLLSDLKPWDSPKSAMDGKASSLREHEAACDWIQDAMSGIIRLIVSHSSASLQLPRMQRRVSAMLGDLARTPEHAAMAIKTLSPALAAGHLAPDTLEPGYSKAMTATILSNPASTLRQVETHLRSVAERQTRQGLRLTPMPDRLRRSGGREADRNLDRFKADRTPQGATPARQEEILNNESRLWIACIEWMISKGFEQNAQQAYMMAKECLPKYKHGWLLQSLCAARLRAGERADIALAPLLKGRLVKEAFIMLDADNVYETIMRRGEFDHLCRTFDDVLVIAREDTVPIETKRWQTLLYRHIDAATNCGMDVSKSRQYLMRAVTLVHRFWDHRHDLSDAMQNKPAYHDINSGTTQILLGWLAIFGLTHVSYTLWMTWIQRYIADRPRKWLFGMNDSLLLALGLHLQDYTPPVEYIVGACSVLLWCNAAPAPMFQECVKRALSRLDLSKLSTKDVHAMQIVANSEPFGHAVVFIGTFLPARCPADAVERPLPPSLPWNVEDYESGHCKLTSNWWQDDSCSPSPLRKAPKATKASALAKDVAKATVPLTLSHRVAAAVA